MGKTERAQRYTEGGRVMEPEELARMLSDLARCGTESRWTIEALADALAGVHYEEGADAVVDFMLRALLAYTPSDTPKGGA